LRAKAAIFIQHRLMSFWHLDRGHGPPYFQAKQTHPAFILMNAAHAAFSQENGVHDGDD
jgi:hypothetical protein